ncbi:MAG: hydantoinase/oxoprolinase family protein [Pseudomonadota bacterium]
MARFLLGVDVGGTFTDFVAYDKQTGQVSAWKNLTTPSDPTTGILKGLDELSNASEIANLRLGTTVATNAILERDGAEIAYVTTKGFRDIPFLQRGHREHHYDRNWIRTKPLVLRRHCFEVQERLLSDGRIETPLDETSVRQVAEQIRELGTIEAIAINLLFSYVNPQHEMRVREILGELLPNIPISSSFDVLPKWKEYERASTTIADAYLKPIVQRYVGDMRDRFDAANVTQQIAMIKSNGGEMSLDMAKDSPVQLTISGPTGGVVAAQAVSKLTASPNVVTLDMGGTSTDCATIIAHDIAYTTDFEISFSLPIQIPMLDIRTIGAGGGSIAWIDTGGMLRVGPQSAGANPGPACYAQGGTQATVTDANLILGRIDASKFLAGKMKLDHSLAEEALDKLGTRLNMSVPEVALAMVRIVNTNMAGALRTVLIERGLDPRDFTLMSFGGAGPLHASDLMREGGITRGIIPMFPGQFSAFGFTLADAKVDLERTVDMTSARFDAPRAATVLKGLREAALNNLRAQGYVDDVTTRYTLEMRYLGQNYEIEIEITFDDFTEQNLLSLWQMFHESHEKRFGFHMPGEVIELTTIKCSATAITEKPTFENVADHDRNPDQMRESDKKRDVQFVDGKFATQIFDRAQLAPGSIINGPALIEESASVTVINPSQQAAISSHGHILLTEANG